MPDGSQPDRVTIAVAIRHGKRTVKAPMNVVMIVVTLGLMFQGILLDGRFHFSLGGKVLLTLLSFMVGLAAYGLVWCWLIPRWRLWAYERVDDLEELERSAVLANLIWPPQHPFGKAEFRPPALAAKLRPHEDAIWSCIQRYSESP
jgi:hypothetical protein